MGRALAGTRRAYTKCGGCGHSRVRHVNGACSDGEYRHADGSLATRPGEPFKYTPCECAAFTEPEGTT